MSTPDDRPLVCPSCGAFVRHDWTDVCGGCGHPLIARSTARSSFSPQDRALRTPVAPRRTSLGVLARTAAVVLALAAAAILVTRIATDSGATTSTGAGVARSDHPSDAIATALVQLASMTSTQPTQGASPDDLSASRWTHKVDPLCRCAADFAWAPSTRDDGDVHTVLAQQPGAWTMSVTSDAGIEPNMNGSQLQEALAAIAHKSDLTLDRATVAENIGLPVVDATLHGHGVTVSARAVQQGTTLYVLEVMTSSTGSTAPVFERFANSFVQTDGVWS